MRQKVLGNTRIVKIPDFVFWVRALNISYIVMLSVRLHLTIFTNPEISPFSAVSLKTKAAMSKY